MKLKSGVSLQGIRPELVIGLLVAETLYNELRGVDMTVTSICDGKHSATSLHYSGCAADLRIWGMTEAEVDILCDAIGEALGKDFDVINEGNHIHLEYQPRR